MLEQYYICAIFSHDKNNSTHLKADAFGLDKPSSGDFFDAAMSIYKKLVELERYALMMADKEE